MTKSKKGTERNLSPLFLFSRFLKPLAITEIKESETETRHRPMFAIWYKRSRNETTKSSPSPLPFLLFFLQRCTRLRLKRTTSPPFWRVDEDLDKYLVSLWWASRKYKRRIPSSLLFRTAWPGTRHSCSRGWKNVEKRGESPGECRAFLLVPARSLKFGNPIFLPDGKRIWSRRLSRLSFEGSIRVT